MPSADLDVSNLVLRTVYLDSRLDEAIRLQAFHQKTSKGELINRYLAHGMELHGYNAEPAALSSLNAANRLERFRGLQQNLVTAQDDAQREQLLEAYLASEFAVVATAPNVSVAEESRVNEPTNRNWKDALKNFNDEPSVGKERPLLFLDFDDVIVVGGPYGGYDVLVPDRPPDLFERLFHRPAVEALLRLLVEFAPDIVPTSSWLRFMDWQTFTGVLKASGLALVERLLHERWRFNQPTGMTRAVAIKEWLEWNHAGEPFAILDDAYSGTGLEGSAFDLDGRVALCEVGVGLTETQEALVRLAFKKPFSRNDERTGKLRTAGPPKESSAE